MYYKPPGHLELKCYLRQINVSLSLVGNLESIDNTEKANIKLSALNMMLKLN